MDRTERVVRMARRRLAASALIDGAGRGLAWGVAIGVGLVLGGKVVRMPWGDAWWLPLAGAVAVAGLAGSLMALRTRRSALDAAGEVDRRLRLKDRLSTATSLGQSSLVPGGAFRDLAIEESDRASARVDMRRAVPLVWGRSWQLWPALAGVAGAIGVWMPSMAHRSESSARAAELAQARATVARELAKAQVIAQPSSSVPTTTNSAEAEKARSILDEVQRELSRGTIDPAAAAEQGARALEQSAAERERSATQEEHDHERLRDDLARTAEVGKSNPGSAPGSIADAIRRGDLAAAANASRDLLNTGSEHSDELRARAAAELEALARDLRDAEQARRAAQRSDASESHGAAGGDSTQNGEPTQTPDESSSTSSQQSAKDRESEKKAEDPAAPGRGERGSPQSQTEQLASAIERAAKDLRREPPSSAPQGRPPDSPASPPTDKSAQASEGRQAGAESTGKQDAGSPQKDAASGVKRPGSRSQAFPDAKRTSPERGNGTESNGKSRAESKASPTDAADQRSSKRPGQTSHAEEESGSAPAPVRDSSASRPTTGEKTRASDDQGEGKDAAASDSPSKHEPGPSGGTQKPDQAASRAGSDAAKSREIPIEKADGAAPKPSPSSGESSDRSLPKNPGNGTQKEMGHSSSGDKSSVPQSPDGKPRRGETNGEARPEAREQPESVEQTQPAGVNGKGDVNHQPPDGAGQTPESRGEQGRVAPSGAPQSEQQPAVRERPAGSSKPQGQPPSEKSDPSVANPTGNGKTRDAQLQPGMDGADKRGDRNAHDRSSTSSPQSPGEAAPEESSVSQSGESLKNLTDTLERLEKQPRQVAEARQDARRLRQQAQDMLRGASPPQSQEMQRWESGTARSSDVTPPSAPNGSSPKPGPVAGRPSAAPGGDPQGEGAQESRRGGLSMADAKSDPVDARATAGGRRNEDSGERVIAEWYSDSKPGREGGGVSTLSAEGEQAVRTATRAGEHALEADAVPSRYDGLLRRYFKRLGDRAASPAQPASALPGKRAEPARDAGDPISPGNTAPKP